MNNSVNLFNNDVEGLVRENINLVHYFAKKIKLEESAFYDYEDIFQIGSIGLLKAAKTYNGKVRFSTYASKCINNEIYLFFRKKRNFISTKSLNEAVYNNKSDSKELMLLDIIPDKFDISSDIEYTNEMELIYNILLNNFSYQRILFVLKLSNSKKQKDMAKELNISQSYVSRLFIKIIEELKKDIKRNNIKKSIFKIKINVSQSEISFCSLDSSKINDLIISLKETFHYIKGLNITYRNNKVTILVPLSNSLIDIIIMIIQNIYDNSINIYEK